MGSLVGVILQEWQIAMHNATVAQLQQQRQQQQIQSPPPKKTDEVKAEKVKDMHVVQDLVSDIVEKPSWFELPHKTWMSVSGMYSKTGGIF